MAVYGRPFDRQAQINRILRRGMPGIAGGRSEAAAPVFRQRLRGIKVEEGGGLPGPGGAPGQPIVDPFKHGRHLLGTVGIGSGSTFGFSTTTGRGTVGTGPVGGDPVDLQGDPYTTWSSSTSPGDYGAITLNAPVVQVGQGNGRGGFVAVAQFGFRALPATGWWFVGFGQGEMIGSDLDSTGVNHVGIGQAEADSTPFWDHNDGTVGGATRVPSGMGAITLDRIYEFRMYANPLGSSFEMRVEEFVGRASAGSVSYTASTNIPLVAGFPFQIVAGNGSGGGTATALFRNAYVAIQPTPDIGIDA